MADADAFLLFGFPLEDPYPWENEDDWEEWVAEKFGVLKPEVEYSDESKQLYQDYWATKQDLFKETEIDIVSTGFCDIPVYVVAARKITAWYGDLKPIDPWDLSRHVFLDRNRLFEWCNTTGIPFQEPKWLLANLYSY